MWLWKRRSLGTKKQPEQAASILRNRGELFPHKQKVSNQKKEIVSKRKLPRKFRKGHWGKVRGLVKGNVNDRNAEKSFVSFRLEEFGDTAKILTVEIISKNVDHFLIQDGDEVVVNGKINNLGTLQARDILIINTNTVYKIRSGFFGNVFFHLLGFMNAVLGLASFLLAIGGLAFNPLISVVGVVGLFIFVPLQKHFSKS